jgi:acylpyruvate hydrolase
VKLISYERQGRPCTGAVRPGKEDHFIDLAALDARLPGDMVAVLAKGPAGLREARAALKHAEGKPGQAWQRLSEVRLLPVVPRPGKIVCVGLNYADHAQEGGNPRPKYPDFFLRGATSLVAHGQPMVLPRVSDRFDFEAELAVVIGQPVRHAQPSYALDAVAGYACFNDGTLRDYQRRTSQWTIGKNFDGTGGFGPWMVTPDELPVGAAGLNIRSRLNGRIMQQANTRDMLWSVAEIIALISECLTLEPGDVIATGTPAGVGYARNPPVFMRAGDSIEIEIDGIATLRNTIRAEDTVETAKGAVQPSARA